MAIPMEQSFYRYLVDSFDILFEGETTPVKVSPGFVNSIYMEKDFDNDFFPVVRINVMLDGELFYKIASNKDTVRFRLRVQKFIHTQSNTTRFKSDVFNEVFCVFLDENTPFLDKKMLDRTREEIGEGLAPQQAGSKEYAFYLFKESDVTNAKKILNTVLVSTTMTNAFVYCLTSAGFNKILLSTFDNKTAYDNVLIPPFTLLGTIDYLQSVYGFYESGMLLFFDLDRTYAISMSAKCTAWGKEEYKKTIFNIKDRTNPNTLSPGTLDKEEEKTYYINVLPGNMEMTALSMIADQTDGNNVYFVDPKTGAVNTRKAETEKRGGGTYKVVMDTYNNLYTRSAETLRREELKNVVDVSIGDFDIDAITPNKEFSLVFEDTALSKTHGGSYRMSKSVVYLIKSGDEFSISGTCTLKKGK